DTEYYTPRKTSSSKDARAGAEEWLHRIRANQVTGKIDPQDVLKARNQAAQLAAKKSTSALGLTWESMGPNDMGGRTRSLLIDKDDPNVMYMGAVSGGLFKTTTAGSSWRLINGDLEGGAAVMSIAQAANGQIYYGTGEDMYASAAGISNNTGEIGGGMFKSTDGGETFSVISSTVPQGNSTIVEWAAIGKVVCDPVNANRVYAATNRGLRVTNDGGATWTNPLTPLSSEAKDMTIDASGRVWVKVGDRFYKSDVSGTVFTEISKSPVGIQPNELPRTAGRSRIAVSPQDDNYVYVVSTTSGNFDKAYRSTDGGAKIGRASCRQRV